MDVAATVKMVCEIIGGLGIFLLGMKNMSEGMRAVAGNNLRRMIGFATNSRYLATIVGTMVTCVVQSSSVTTVMVVGFVNSGVMELTQAVGVIMGANIGTTITGWILVLKVGKYGLPLLGVAAFVYLFSKRDRWRYWAMATMGIGMVFFGLELMKDACAMIKAMPEFEAWFNRFDASTYAGVLGCALAGCVLTTIVQSSSATLGVTISLATTGVISLETAAALVLGENLGTTVTALLASIGATTNARRAAYFHCLFNILGVLWITLIFSWYILFVKSIIPLVQLVFHADATTVGIATVHTVFNVTNTLLLLPFVPLAVRMLNRIVPSGTFREKPRLTASAETPAIAIEQSRQEIIEMGEGCVEMLRWVAELSQQENRDHELSDRLEQRQNVLASMQDEVAYFVTDLLSQHVPDPVAEEARAQLRVVHEYELAGAAIADLNTLAGKLRRQGKRFTSRHLERLAELNRHTAEHFAAVNEAFMQDGTNVPEAADPVAANLRDEIEILRRAHLDQLADGGIATEVSVAWLATLNAYARVGDHLHNITEAISGEK